MTKAQRRTLENHLAGVTIETPLLKAIRAALERIDELEAKSPKYSLVASPEVMAMVDEVQDAANRAWNEVVRKAMKGKEKV